MLTEKEKMTAGRLYHAADPLLTKERQYAKELLYDYNHLRPTQLKQRTALLTKLFGGIGEGFLIEQPFQCDYGFNIQIGSHFYANVGCIMLNCAKITIGNHVYPAQCAFIYSWSSYSYWTAQAMNMPVPLSLAIEYGLAVIPPFSPVLQLEKTVS